MPFTTPRVIQVIFDNIPNLFTGSGGLDAGGVAGTVFDPNTPVVVFAGEDQNIICEPTVTMIATIDDPETFKHTFEWVQTSGTVVTINGANTLTAWFTNPNTDDLSFRIYVDRYTPIERYDDITVYRTPTSETATGGDLGTGIAYLDALSDTVVQNELALTASVVPRYYSDDLVTEDVGAFVTTEYMLVWTIPSDIRDFNNIPFQNTPIQSYEFLGAYVQRYSGGTWITSAFIPKVREYYILPTNDGTPYRVQAVWKLKQRVGLNNRKFEERIFVITPGNWGILRSFASSPAPLRVHGNSGGALGNRQCVSTQFNFNFVITNPSRISLLGEDTGVIGSANDTSLSINDYMWRVQGLLYDDTDAGVVGSTNLASTSTTLSITRVAGISIG